MTDWQQDLIEALSALGLSQGEGMTTREYAERAGVSIVVADRRLLAYWRQGKIESFRKTIQTRAGFSRTVPAYRLKGDKM